MATKDWYAQGLNALLAWWANFITRRPEFEAKYPILATKATELEKAGAWIAYWVAQRKYQCLSAFVSNNLSGKKCKKVH